MAKDPQKEGSITVKTLVLFFLLDNSRSMIDEGKITQVNQAFRECFGNGGSLTRFAEHHTVKTQANVKIAALEFSTGADWITINGPIPIGDFPWNDLEAKGTSTDMGEAFKKLSSVLYRKNFLSDPQGYKVPYYILVTDGLAMDDWEYGLNELKKSEWFTKGIKIAIAVGEDANEDEALKVLEAFAGSREAIISIMDCSKLAELIKVLTMTVIKEGSKPPKANQLYANNSEDNPDQNEAIEVIKETMEEAEIDMV